MSSGVEREDALGGFNRAVEILLSVVGLREAMQRVAKFGIEFEGPRVFSNCVGHFSFAEQIDPSVVMIFSGFPRVFAHADILASAGGVPSLAKTGTSARLRQFSNAGVKTEIINKFAALV